jgi:hypothetical protein
MAFLKFQNGQKYLDLAQVALIQPPSGGFSGGSANVTFTTSTGHVFTIYMDETKFNSLGLPIQ